MTCFDAATDVETMDMCLEKTRTNFIAQPQDYRVMLTHLLEMHGHGEGMVPGSNLHGVLAYADGSVAELVISWVGK